MTTIRIDLRRFDAQLGLAPPPAIDAPLADAWRAAAFAWAEPATHDALVGLAVKHGALGWLASRYRERSDDPIAVRQLERVSRAAALVLLAARPRAQAEPNMLRKLVWSLALCAMATAGALAGARVVVDRAAAHPRPTAIARP